MALSSSVGTFDLWLCTGPDHGHAWLVVSVGVWTEPQLFDEEPAARIGHFGFTPHHPLLFLPRPPGPVTFTARVTSGAFPARARRVRRMPMRSAPPTSGPRTIPQPWPHESNAT
ncbi:hypothetical protein [Streptomyces sp. NPDC050856]|uniref:hypothetical protein n=1 Tax=Streptomyces sp. NPDC050856 TaxID=3154939 RepID=UPI0033FB4AB8